jgi:TP901 family phage tail tape measure protein/lambda family phage tail tape measure protein
MADYSSPSYTFTFTAAAQGLDSVQASARNATSGLDRFNTSAGNTPSKLDSLLQRLEALERGHKSLTKAQEDAARGLGSMAQEIKENAKVWQSWAYTQDGVRISLRKTADLSEESVKQRVAENEAIKQQNALQKEGMTFSARVQAARKEDIRLAKEYTKTMGSYIAESNRLGGTQRTGPARAALALVEAQGASAARSFMEVNGVRSALSFVEANKSNESLRELNAQLRILERGGPGAVEAYYGSLVPAVGETRKFSSGVREINSGVKEASRSTREFTESQDRLRAALRGVSGSFGALWMTYSRYMGTLATAVSVTAAFKKTMSSGIEFDYQTRFVAAVGDDRRPAAYQGIQEGLLGIKDAPANVNELARALRVLAQTGVEAHQGISILPTAIAASTLGEVSMKTATEDLIGVMETFNLRSSDSEVFERNFKKAGDVMAYVAKETKADLHDVAMSLQGVTGVAEQYGVKLSTVASMITMLGKAGIVGTKASTYSRQMLENLYVPTSKGAESAMKQLGFSMFDEAGNLKNDLQSIVELVSKIKEYNPESAARIINTLFNSRAARVFRVIYNDVDDFIAKSKEAEAQTGSLQRMMDEVSQSTSIQLKLLKADWDNLFTRAWDQNDTLAGPIRNLRDALSDPTTVEGLRTLASTFVSLGTTVVNHAGAITATTAVLGSLYAGYKIGGLAATTFSAVLTKGSDALTKMAYDTVLARGSLLTLADGMKSLSVWATRSLPGIGLLFAGIGTAAYLMRDKTLDALRESGEAMSRFSKQTKQSVKEIFEQLGKVDLAVSETQLKAQLTDRSIRLKSLGDSLALVKKATGGRVTDFLSAEKFVEQAQASFQEQLAQEDGGSSAFTSRTLADFPNLIVVQEYLKQRNALREAWDENARAETELILRRGAQTDIKNQAQSLKEFREINEAEEARLNRLAEQARANKLTNDLKQESNRLAAESTALDIAQTKGEISLTDAILRKAAAQKQAASTELGLIGAAIQAEIAVGQKAKNEVQREASKNREDQLRGKLAEVHDRTRQQGLQTQLALAQALANADKTGGRIGDRLDNLDEKGRDKTLSSELKKERLRLDTEILNIDIAQARQEINLTDALARKDAAQQQSLSTERALLEAAIAVEAAEGKKAKTGIQKAEAKNRLTKLQGDLEVNQENIDKKAAQSRLERVKAETALKNAREDSAIAAKRTIQDLDDERLALGKTTREVNLLRIAREHERIAEDLKTKIARNDENKPIYEQQLKDNEFRAAQRKLHEEEQHTFAWGWKDALGTYATDATDAAGIARNVFQSTTTAMEDSLYNFVTTGKASFRDFADTVLKELARIAAKQAAMGLIKMAANAIIGNGGDTALDVDAMQNSVNQLALQAKGGIFTSPSLSRYSNGIYDSPQVFAFAHGAGMFAEAGPEGILPLTRMASGNLGVEARGAGIAPQVSVVNNVTITSGGEGNKTEKSRQSRGEQGSALAQMLEASTMQILMREMRPGGLLSGA